MKCIYFVPIILWITGCGNHQQVTVNKKAIDTISLVTNDTIPEIRKTVRKAPVATYLVTVNDPKLDRKFGASVYETRQTFTFLLRMQYEAVEATDTLKIPNFGIWPVVDIHPGKDRQTCIIGFLDKKGAFKAYKMLSAKGNTMKLTVLKKYFTGRYSNTYK